MITVDCGISAIEEVKYANSLGLEVIVTDHHEPGEELPAAIAVVDAKRKDNKYVKSVFSAIRPVVVGMIASAALLLMNKENFPDYTKSIAICAVAFLLVRYAKLHPILIVILAGITGYLLY